MKRLALLIALALIPARLHAATIEVLGVPLKVEAAEPLQDHMLRVAAFGEERIVAESQAPGFVLNAYVAHHAAASVAVADAETMIRTGLKTADLDGSSDALLLLMGHPEMSQSEEDSFLDSITGDPSCAELLRRTVQQVATLDVPLRGVLVAPVLFRAGVSDTEWTRQNGVRVLYRYFDEVRSYLEGRFLEALSLASSGPSDKVLDVMGALLGENDAAVQDFRAVAQRIRSVREALHSKDIADTLQVLSVSSDASRAGKILEQVLSSIVLDECDRLLGAGDAGRVLLLLGSAPTLANTPRTHALAGKALAGLESPEVLSNRKVQDLLISMSANDAFIKEAFLKVLDAWAHSTIDSGDVLDADVPLSIALLVRPDPEAANDAIRIDQVRHLLAQGKESSAVERLVAIKTRMGLADRLWFAKYRLLRKIPIWSLLILCVVVGVMLAFTWHLLQRRQRLVEARWRALGWIEDDEAPKEVRGAFVMKEVRSQIDPVVQEYFDCLKVFSLKPGASPRELKSAYRVAMKKVHPDLNAGDEASSSTEFIRIRKAYERLLKMEEEGVPLQFRS